MAAGRYGPGCLKASTDDAADPASGVTPLSGFQASGPPRPRSAVMREKASRTASFLIRRA